MAGDLETGYRRSEWLAHLPKSEEEALTRYHATEKARHNLEQGFYRDIFVPIFALPKSMSSYLSRCIESLIPAADSQPSYNASYGLSGNTPGFPGGRRDDKTLALRPEIVLDYPNGGVLHSHASASNINCDVLEILSVKYVIHVRHPLDQLVAMYCQRRRYGGMTEAALGRETMLATAIYPLDPSFMALDVPVNRSIEYMITGGYLHGVLDWIGNWLHYRDRNNSIVTRYEDFVTDQESSYRILIKYLFGIDLSPEQLKAAALPHSENEAEFMESVSAEIYPRGYSGVIGIWREYFSDENRKLCAHIMNAYLSSHPNATHLSKLYPELLDFRSI